MRSREGEAKGLRLVVGVSEKKRQDATYAKVRHEFGMMKTCDPTSSDEVPDMGHPSWDMGTQVSATCKVSRSAVENVTTSDKTER